MTFVTDNYTSAGAKTLKTITDPTKNIYVFVDAGDADKYKIQYRVDASGKKNVIRGMDNLKGETYIENIGFFVAEVGINIETNDSADITLEIKEY